MAQLSDMLTYLRKRKGLSQQELANTLKISRSAIGMYETGKREPDLETLEVFADFYNVDMNTLTGKAPIKEQTNKLPDNAVPVDFSHLKRIPILGRIAASTPKKISRATLLPTLTAAQNTLLCAYEVTA